MDSVQAALNDAQKKLQTFGPLPDPAEVESAERNIVEVERRLAAVLHQLDVETAPDSVSGQQFLLLQEKRKEVAREDAEEAKRPHLALLERHRQAIQLQEVVRLAQAALAAGDEAAAADFDSLSRLSAAAGPSSAADDTGPRSSRYLKAARDRAVLQAIQTCTASDAQTLDLSGRNIDWLPEPLGKLGCVKTLDLSGNSIEVLPDVLAGLTSLATLNLHGNLLSTLPPSIGLLSALESLDASSNRLQRLPDSIVNLSALVVLNLNFNSLEKLPDRFGAGYPRLQKLSVALNKLSSLPPSIGALASLTFLDVHFNRLQALPDAIGQLSALETLLASDNFADLTAVPASVGNLSALRHLDVRNNQIHELPSALGRLTGLERLELDGNPWQSPPLELVSKKDTYLVKVFLADKLREEMRLMEAGLASDSWMAWFGGLLGDLSFVQWLSAVVAGTPIGAITGGGVLGIEGGTAGRNGAAEARQQLVKDKDRTGDLEAGGAMEEMGAAVGGSSAGAAGSQGGEGNVVVRVG